MISTMKESKAELVKRLREVFAVEDDFPGYLGNPSSLGIILPSMRRKPVVRHRKPAARRTSVPSAR